MIPKLMAENRGVKGYFWLQLWQKPWKHSWINHLIVHYDKWLVLDMCWCQAYHGCYLHSVVIFDCGFNVHTFPYLKTLYYCAVLKWWCNIVHCSFAWWNMKSFYWTLQKIYISIQLAKCGLHTLLFNERKCGVIT